jgi:hypothetical protein
MKKAWEVWNELLEKPEVARSATERIVVRVNSFLIDFENGSWLYNISPDVGEGGNWQKLRQTAESVAAVGVPSVAHRLQQIADIVEKTDVQRSGTWGGFLTHADPNNKVQELEASISDELSIAWAKLEEFTVQHFECEPGA